MLNKTAINKIIKKHFTVSHRKTSNVDLCLLNFIFSCRFFDIKDYLLSLKKKIASFQFAGILPQYHLRLNTVKFSNRSVQEAICKTRNDESGNGMRGIHLLWTATRLLVTRFLPCLPSGCGVYVPSGNEDVGSVQDIIFLYLCLV